MRPPKREYEQVKVDEWLTGEITDIQYDKEKEFTYKGIISKQSGVRFVINLDGYTSPKYSRWLKFMYSEKSNLFKLFIQPLVMEARPYMDFDLDSLKNLRIKVMYQQDGEYQNLMAVRPDSGKVLAKPHNPDEDEVPF